jgi:GxxExxY protein
LEKRGLRTLRQQAVPILYPSARIETGFRADLIVEDNVIVEIKSVEAVVPVPKKQLLTHLRLANKRLGLLNSISMSRSSRMALRASPTACRIDLTQSRQGTKMPPIIWHD